MNYPKLALSAVVIAFLSACGGPNQGPQTHQYLVQMSGALDQLNSELHRENAPQPPPEPDLQNKSAVAQGEALTKFSVELTRYYAAVEKSATKALASCDQAQSKIRALDGTNVDPAAVALSDKFTGLLNRRQQLGVDMQSLISDQQAALRKNRAPRAALLQIVTNGINTLTGMSSESVAEPAAGGKSGLDATARSVLRATAEMQSDGAATAAAQADLASALKTKYPDTDWGFLAAHGAR